VEVHKNVNLNKGNVQENHKVGRNVTEVFVVNLVIKCK